MPSTFEISAIVYYVPSSPFFHIPLHYERGYESAIRVSKIIELQQMILTFILEEPFNLQNLLPLLYLPNLLEFLDLSNQPDISDTPGIPGAASIVEWTVFESIQPLWQCNRSKNTNRKVAGSSMSHLKAHAGHFRLLVKGIFNAYVLWPFGKNFIS